MPSPIGHSLVGAAVGLLVWRRMKRQEPLTGTAAPSPDEGERRAAESDGKIGSLATSATSPARDLAKFARNSEARGQGRMWMAAWWGAVMFCAVAPDLDFLPGLMAGELNAFHHGASHSLVWIGWVALGVWCLGRGIGLRWGRCTGWALVAAGVSHLVADAVCEDRSGPYGIPALWPFSEGYLIAPFFLFRAMKKDTVGQVFTWGNLGPAVQEVAIGLLCIGAAWWWSRRREVAA